MYITWSCLYEYDTKKNRAKVWLVTENVLEIFLSLSVDRRYLGLAPNKSYINELDTVSTVSVAEANAKDLVVRCPSNLSRLHPYSQPPSVSFSEL